MPRHDMQNTPFDWHAYVAKLSPLSALIRAEPGPEMAAERARLEDTLLPEAPYLPHDGVRATVLEDALKVGAARLVRAIEPVGTPGLAALKPGEWMHFVLKHATLEMVRDAIARDLALDGAVNGLWLAAIDDPDWRSLLLEDISRDRWWLPYPGMISRWFFDRTDTDLACAFMRAQVAHHPDRAANAMRLSHDHLKPFHEQVVLLRAGALCPEGVPDRLDEVLRQAPSNHARMDTVSNHIDLETIHRHYSL